MHAGPPDKWKSDGTAIAGTGGRHAGALLSRELESIAAIRAHADQRVSHHQRLLEGLVDRLGRPLTLYVFLVLVVGWVCLNTWWPLPTPIPDEPPYFWLQGVIGLMALLMTTLVLITENRQSRDAEHRAHLDLQVNLATEQKVAKLIALIEELRRDLPNVRDRRDIEAEEMQSTVDPEAALAEIEQIAVDDERNPGVP